MSNHINNCIQLENIKTLQIEDAKKTEKIIDIEKHLEKQEKMLWFLITSVIGTLIAVIIK